MLDALIRNLALAKLIDSITVQCGTCNHQPCSLYIDGDNGYIDVWCEKCNARAARIRIQEQQP